MSQQPGPQTVRIKLEIEVPYGAPVSVNGQDAAPSSNQLTALAVKPIVESTVEPMSLVEPKSKPFALTSLGVTPPVKVHLTSGTNTGYICVRVTGQLSELNQPPTTVWAKVAQSQITTLMAMGPGVASGANAGGDWSILKVDGAICGTGASNWLTIYAQFPDGEITRTVLPFVGTGSNATDCEAGKAEGGGPPVTLPSLLTVVGNCFEGAAIAALNQKFELQLVPSDSTNWIWDNGGCGSAVPRVEFIKPRCGCGPGKLVFKYGEATVRYSAPGSDWISNGPMTLSTVWACGVPENCELPGSVELIPS